MKTFIKNIFIAHRIEFTPVTIAIIVAGMLLGCNNINDIFNSNSVLIFITVNVATYWGSIYNVYYDYEFDKRNKSKIKLSKSIDLIGKKRVRYYLIVEFLIFMGIGIYLALERESVLSIILLVVGSFFTVAYSKEPLRFKRKGFLNSLSLFLVIMFLPPLYGYILMTDQISSFHLLIIMGLAIVEYGLGLYYTTVDYTEDKKDDIVTPSVILGVRRSVFISLLLLIIGNLLFAYSYYSISNSYLVIAIASSGVLFSFLWILILYMKGRNCEDRMEQIVKENQNTIPLWVFLSALGVLIANLVIIIYKG